MDMFDGIQDWGFVLLWLCGSGVGGFIGGVAAIYWCRREE